MKHEIPKIILSSLVSGGFLSVVVIAWYSLSDNLATSIARSDPIQIEIERKIDARFNELEDELREALVVLESRVHGMSSRVGVLASKIENQNEKLTDTNRLLERMLFPSNLQEQSKN